MQIKLKDGTEYEGAANTTPEELIIFAQDMNEFVTVYNTMTDENLSELTIEDTVYSRRMVETKTYRWLDKVEAHFVTLPVDGGEYKDKAEAFDILMGGAS